MRPAPLVQIRACAQEIILRDFGFWALVVIMISIALMDEPDLALAVGGILNLVWCAALAICAERARHRDYRRTEVWQVLKDQIDMPSRTAQIVFSQTLRAAYLRGARFSGVAAAVFLTMASLWYAGHHFSDEIVVHRNEGTFLSTASGQPAAMPARLRH